jgi:hypothetical protein
MKIYLTLIVCLAILHSCYSKKTEKIKKIKSDHEKRINFLKVAPNMFGNKVPDSMKKWLPILRNVSINDQKYRAMGLDISDYTSDELAEKARLDSLNLQIVTTYLDTYGWPTFFCVGLIGQRAIGMTIQHAELKIQEKYYPFVVEAYKKDTMLFETLALLEDRINVKNNRYQFYGTQIINYKGKGVPYPIANVDSLEFYRSKLGLKFPFKFYMSLVKQEWNIDEYKRIFPDLVKESKVTDKKPIHYRKN